MRMTLLKIICEIRVFCPIENHQAEKDYDCGIHKERTKASQHSFRFLFAFKVQTNFRGKAVVLSQNFF